MLLKQIFFTFFTICVLSITGCKEDKKAITQTKIAFKKEGELTIFKSDATQIQLDIEIADTDFDVQTGLMYRDTMAENQGMLFVFDDEKPRSFYMKNTRMPLDIIYISADKKIVSFQKNAQPFNENSLPSNLPAQYVLEINAGLADTWQLKLGDSLAY